MEDTLIKIDRIWTEKILSEYRTLLHCESNEQLKKECEHILELLKSE